MIQRIQTLYLLAAVALCIACLCLPIGTFISGDGETAGTLYNLWVHQPAQIAVGQPSATPVLASEASGTHLFAPWALFAVLLFTTGGLSLSIFLYRTRLVQSRLVMLCCILLVAWYAVYAAFVVMLNERFDSTFQFTPWAAFPAIAAICSYLAFRGIIKDEMLVRSLDRLR